MKTNVLTLIITLVVGIILAGSLLGPVISDAQKTIGTPTTVTNVMNTSSPNYTIWDGSDIVIEYDATNKVYSIDGVSNNFAAATQRILVASNDFACRNGGSTDNPQILSQYVTEAAQISHTSFTFRVINKSYSFEVPGVDPYVGTLEWMVYAEDSGTTNLGQINQSAGTWYTSEQDKLIVLGNIYTTGENDTFYSYYDGDLTVNSAYEDVSSVTINKTLAEGYTDIYATTITINIGDESFTPYFILTPKTVEGHEASGGAYSLLGAIPIMVIVALLMIAVGAIAYRRAD